MSHDYGRRDGCSAAGMTDVVVGSGALFGSFPIERNFSRSVLMKASTSDSAPFLRIQMSLLDSLVLRITVYEPDEMRAKKKK